MRKNKMKATIDFNNQTVQRAVSTFVSIVGPDRPVAIVGPDIVGPDRVIIIGHDRPPIPDPPPEVIANELAMRIANALKHEERKMARKRIKALKAYTDMIEKALVKGSNR